jgi:cytochrome c oxidase subunit 3
MWLFLAQEVMFFGGLFTLYMVYRSMNSLDFALASSELNVPLGFTNTLVLIGSSVTMALAVKAAQLSKRKRLVGLLIATILLGCVFLVVKYFEYSAKWEHSYVPGFTEFAWGPEPAAIEALELSPERVETMKKRGEIFFSIYFTMTGLHALHMIIGIALGIWLLFPSWKGRFDMNYHNPVENFGLYWHFVDLVWIFLFPLLYLLGRNMHF